tara:strand:- start:138 stop:464 length:327 start_codon:yes stop_codon:yes gene_type:complete
MNTSLKTWVQLKAQKPYYKKPKTDSKLIKENTEKYSKQIKQLNHIINDDDYYTNDGYFDFIKNMYNALVSGRKISVKMESAIQGISVNMLNGFYKKIILSIKNREKYL